MTKDELQDENETLKSELEQLQQKNAELQNQRELDAAAAKGPGAGQMKPSDLSEYKGSYKNSAGEVFGLKELKPEDAPNGKTHLLKNEQHYWEGTKEEFKAEFEKD